MIWRGLCSRDVGQRPAFQVAKANWVSTTAAMLEEDLLSMTEQANPAAGTDSNLGLARRVICGVLVVAALTFTISGHSLGQSYPTKVIKLIVPFGPGGPTDLAARLASQIVQTSLGKV